MHVDIYPPSQGNKKIKNETMEMTRDVNATVQCKEEACFPNIHAPTHGIQ